ncbi:MAG: response regulator [Burkholderiales bacterium]|jgi:two-component system chemotaxis response regulator CheY|uniref:response regulator n=1 Tax=Limnobacter sp. TaxID=2003368 RepID=UPI0039BD6028|nr:response regulator [Burkholderiales bacterium]
MFTPYINILAMNFKKTLESMTEMRIYSQEIIKNEEKSKLFSVASVIPYQDLEKKFTGEFTLGFTDETMAIVVASAIGKKLGLATLELLDQTAEEVLNEFMNILTGRAISEWDTKGLSVRFSPPSLVRNKKVELEPSLTTHIYQIILNLSEGVGDPGAQVRRLNFTVTFSEPGIKKPEKKILVADDSGIFRRLFAKTIREAGFEVEEAIDGVDAVEKHSAFKPDLTLMDINMPRMSGLDAIAKVKESQPNAGFIVMTSSSRKDEVMTAKQLGVLNYIIKPVEPAKIVEKINKALA